MSDLRGGPGAEETNDPPDDSIPSRTPPVHISVLGPLQIDARGKRVPVKAHQQRRLIALLAAAATERRPLSAEHIADALYEGRGGDKARSATATAVWRLRQLLGADALDADAAGYSLVRSRCAIDALEFETLVDQGQRHLRSGDGPTAAEHLRSALALWRGEPLPDLADHADGRAVSSRFIELRLGATEDLAEALAASNEPAEAIALLEPLTAAHPAREHAWALLIECYELDGHRRRARQSYDVAVRHLAEHGLEPGAELAAARGGLDDAPDDLRGLVTAREDRAARAATATAAQRALVGRDLELTTLLDAIRAASTERTIRLIVVTGEAGIGKSTLLNAAAAAVEAEGMAVARGTGDLRIELPYATLASVLEVFGAEDERVSTPLEQLKSTMRGPSATEAVITDKASLADAIAERLEQVAADRPGGVAVLIDDAHWATPATLDVLLHVLARRRRVPLVLVAAVRQPTTMADGIAELLAELRRRASVTIELRGLDQTAVGVLLGEAGAVEGTAAWAHGVSGGNPLYVTQLATLDLATLRTDNPVRLPATLDDAIGARLAMLPEGAMAALRIAAVAGPSFDARVVTAAAVKVLPVTANEVVDAIGLSVTAGVVLAEKGATSTYRFVHTLTAKHLYDSLSADDRCEAHVAVGAALERLSTAAAPPFAQLAHHFGHGWPACPATVAARHLRAAGDRSAAQLDFARAGDLYGRALDLLAIESSDVGMPRLEADLLARAADSAVFDDDLPRARATYARLAVRAVADDDVNDQLRAAVGLVATYAAERTDPASVDALRTSVEAAAARSAEVDADLLAAALANLYRFQPDRAHQLMDAVVTEPRLAAVALPRVWEQESVADQLRTAALCELAGVDPHRAWLRSWVSELAAGSGAFTSPPPRPAGEPLAGSEAHWELSMWRITEATAKGDLERAQRLIARAGDSLRDPDALGSTRRTTLGLASQASILAIARGDFATALDTIGGMRRTWPTRGPVGRALNAMHSAHIGDAEEATQICDELVDELIDAEEPAGHFLARTGLLGRACVASGNARGIAACREALAPASGQHVFFYITMYLGSVNRALASLALAQGDLDAAGDYAEMALDDHRRIGSPLYVADIEAQLETVRHLRAEGDRAPGSVRSTGSKR